jgi:2,5-furandicarboxylate decarboxylase 1
MGLDATKPLSASEMTFKRIRVPGEESVDLDRDIDPAALPEWRRTLTGG